MRVRLTDGAREIEVEGRTTTPLADLTDAALRLLAALPPPTEQTHPTPPPIGFTADLDRIALDAHTERAEPAVDELLPDEYDQAQHEPTSTRTNGDTHP